MRGQTSGWIERRSGIGWRYVADEARIDGESGQRERNWGWSRRMQLDELPEGDLPKRVTFRIGRSYLQLLSNIIRITNGTQQETIRVLLCMKLFRPWQGCTENITKHEIRMQYYIMINTSTITKISQWYALEPIVGWWIVYYDTICPTSSWVIQPSDPKRVDDASPLTLMQALLHDVSWSCIFVKMTDRSDNDMLVFRQVGGQSFGLMPVRSRINQWGPSWIGCSRRDAVDGHPWAGKQINIQNAIRTGTGKCIKINKWIVSFSWIWK